MPFSHRRISDSILTLRAASILKEHIVSLSEIEKDGNSLTLKEIIGDFGLILFNPLDEELLFSPELWVDELCHNEASLSDESTKSVDPHVVPRLLSSIIISHENDPSTHSESSEVPASCLHASSESSCTSSCDGDEYVFDHEVYPVQIEPPEDPSELSFAPRILDDETFQQIVDEAIPRSLRIYKWKRLFSIALDGDLFFTMLDKCASFRNTLLVLKTTKGNVLGGFASEHWKAQDGFGRHSYFGTGTCFLFSDYPANSNPKKGLSFYKWSGVNDYCQICEPESGTMAMGGGEGDFGLIIEDSFLQGSSGHCATFKNPQLIPGIDGTFDILEFEVYGLLPLIPTVSRAPTHKFSQRSLLRERA
jgi:hypothetical protein